MLVVTMRMDVGLRKDWIEVKTPEGDIINIYLKQVKGKQVRIGVHAKNSEIKITREGTDTHGQIKDHPRRTPLIKDAVQSH